MRNLSQHPLQRAFLLGFVMLALSTLAHAQQGLARTLGNADRAKIQRVISSQIKAFEREDDLIAFSYAAPAVRRYFGSPQAFMEMVKTGYESLYRNRSAEFLEASVIDGNVIQPLRIVTFDGDVVVALFTMEQQSDKEWRVSGCEIAESTVQAA